MVIQSSLTGPFVGLFLTAILFPFANSKVSSTFLKPVLNPYITMWKPVNWCWQGGGYNHATPKKLRTSQIINPLPMCSQALNKARVKHAHPLICAIRDLLSCGGVFCPYDAPNGKSEILCLALFRVSRFSWQQGVTRSPVYWHRCFLTTFTTTNVERVIDSWQPQLLHFGVIQHINMQNMLVFHMCKFSAAVLEICSDRPAGYLASHDASN